MANYSSTASVVLSVNGAQAKKVLTSLQSEAQKLERKLAAASKAGDQASMSKLQRELNSTKKLIDQMKGSAASAESVLRRLDQATPRELNKTLRTLQTQLNGVKRGTAAWDAHVAKIRAVKAEIQKVNAAMASQKSGWGKMNGWINSCATALMGMAAGVTGLIMAGRKAVQQYAEMDEQLANTRKYTGMTVQEVEKLNDAFRAMDTRTARSKLNELAQEAGRLGKHTLKDVQGYVEAADIINVALVDLGEGATQTIAKLTNIFGVDAALGTKDAMLSVGSAVNVLSQNCTASKPYLVEFAQRMAGIGAQAGMTIPEILAFGAVLDANGQKVEMSATAIQKVIMNLAGKNKAFAKTLGMDAEQLNETLKHSAKDGLLMFLDRLHEIGESSGYKNATLTLEPAFKDMGLDAARVAQVLSTLAKHVDEVKWQIGEANTAFQEASSATNEYTIFNNTAQAAIDKAKKRIDEMSESLGKKLYPVMKHIYTSSGIFLRVLNTMVDTFIEFRTPILMAVSAVATYYATVALCATKTALLTAATKLSNAAHATFTYTLGLGRVAVTLFTQGVGAATTSFKALNATMKANPLGLVLGAVTSLAVAFLSLKKETDAYEAATRKAKAAAGGFSEEAVREQRELDQLFGKLEGAEKGTRQYNEAKKELLSNYSQYLHGLINEKGEVVDLALAYDRLTKAVRRSNAEKGIKAAAAEADAQYYKDQADLLTKLQNNIEYWTGDVKEAAALTAKVASALTSGKSLDKATSKRLQQISGQRTPTNGSTWDKVTSWVNTSMFAGTNQALFGWTGRKFTADQPVEIYNDLVGKKWKHDDTSAATEGMLDGIDPYRKHETKVLQEAVDTLQELVKNAKGGNVNVPVPGSDKTEAHLITAKSARNLFSVLSEELALRLGSEAKAAAIDADEPDSTSPAGGSVPSLNLKESAEDKKERLAAERAAKKALQESLKDQRQQRDEQLAELERQRADDLVSEKEYLNAKDALQVKYQKDCMAVLEKRGLQDTQEYAAAAKKVEEITSASAKRMEKLDLAEARVDYTNKTSANKADLNDGSQNHAQYLQRQAELDEEYVERRLKIYLDYNQTECQEYANLLKEKETLNEKSIERRRKAERDTLDRRHRSATAEMEERFYTPGSDIFMDRNAYEEEVFAELQTYLKRKRETYTEASDEWNRINEQLQQLEASKSTDDKKQYAENYKKMMPEETKKAEYDNFLSQLEAVYNAEMELAEDNEERKSALTKAYHEARVAAAEQYGQVECNSIKKAMGKVNKWLTGKGGQALQASLSTLNSGLSDIFSGLTTMIQAEVDEQTAAIEERYDDEVSRAEGNTYQIAQLEQEKEDEIAEIKNEANRKQYAMQVIQAISQTATNALSAYGSAAQVPIVGYILAPIAAAMAVASGMIQVAAIKKQQQASEAQGYAEGGFTPDGSRDTAVGVVHAGEWVASQKLVKDSRTRPLLEALDYAQRNNAVSTLTPSAVSALMPVSAGTATAASGLTRSTISRLPSAIGNSVSQSSAAQNSELSSTLRLLNTRLNEPFVTVNTVTGSKGSKKAQDDYDTMINNKSPKSKHS